MKLCARRPRLADELGQDFAAFEHIVERPEHVHVVADKAELIETAEQRGEIEIALAGLQMHFLAVTEAIGETDLVAAADIHAGQEAVDAFRHEMRMVAVKAQRSRGDFSRSK